MRGRRVAALLLAGLLGTWLPARSARGGGLTVGPHRADAPTATGRYRLRGGPRAGAVEIRPFGRLTASPFGHGLKGRRLVIQHPGFPTGTRIHRFGCGPPEGILETRSRRGIRVHSGLD